MLADSELLRDFSPYAFSTRGDPLCLYGYSAYPLRVHLQTPFCIVAPNPLMEEYNRSMSSVRISVEWIFGDISKKIKFVDLKRNLKMALSSLGKIYIVSDLLCNAYTCLFGNTISQFFEQIPPSLQEYFH